MCDGRNSWNISTSRLFQNLDLNSREEKHVSDPLRWEAGLHAARSHHPLWPCRESQPEFDKKNDVFYFLWPRVSS